MSTAVKTWQFLLTCWKLNLAGAMEFRMSFLLTAGMMLLNNTVWIFFWGVYFTRFPLVNGWQMHDVMMLWAVSAGAFGLMAVFFGNSLTLANVIATGQLDTYLAQPKPVLLHVLVSRMSVSAIGDIAFSLILYGIFGEFTLLGIAKFAVALLLAMVILMFFTIIGQSLAFYIGNAEGLGFQLFNTMLTFTTYPTDIFRGLGRAILFTVIPAGFISYLPIGFLRETQWSFFLTAAGVALLLWAGGTWFFYRGLKKYGSGNMLSVRM